MLLVTDFISCCGNVRILEKPRVEFVSCRPISENCAQNGPHTVNWLVRMERSLRSGFCGGSQSKIISCEGCVGSSCIDHDGLHGVAARVQSTERQADAEMTPYVFRRRTPQAPPSAYRRAAARSRKNTSPARREVTSAFGGRYAWKTRIASAESVKRALRWE